VAELHDRRGRVLRSLGKPDEAIKELTRAVECWDPATDVDELVNSAVEIGLTYLWQADLEPAGRMTAEVLARLEHATPVQRWPLLHTNAMLIAGAGRAAEALAALDEADAVRREANVPALDLFALGGETHLRWTMMDLHRAAALSREAVARFEAAGLVWQAADIAYVAAYCGYFHGRLPTETELDVIGSRARRVGHGPALGVNELLRAYVAFHHGDFGTSERICGEVLAHSRIVQNRWGYFSHLFAGYLALLQGRTEQALANLEEAERIEPPTYWLGQAPRTRFWALANIAPPKAAEILTRLHRGPVDPDVPNPFGAWLNIAVLVPGLALIGRRDEAASYARNAETLIERGMVCVTWYATSHQVAGIATGCAAEWDTSEAHFRKALEVAASTPLRPEEAGARISYADMLRHRDRPGDRERARVLCGEAESMAAKLGAELYEQRARDVRNTL
jgi:tetratricopeptide (TPR) repeat protein